MEPIKIADYGRGPGLERIRITVFDLIPFWRKGWKAWELAFVFPITKSEAEALIQYIEDHKEEVMAVNAKIEERIARGNSAEIEAIRKGSKYRPILEARLQEALRRHPEDDDGTSPAQ